MKTFSPGQRLRSRARAYTWLLPALLAAFGGWLLVLGAAAWGVAFGLLAATVAVYLVRSVVEVDPDGVLRRTRMLGQDVVDLQRLTAVVVRRRRGVLVAVLADSDGRRARVDAVVGEPEPAFAAILHYAQLPDATVELSERSAGYLDAGAIGRRPM